MDRAARAAAVGASSAAARAAAPSFHVVPQLPHHLPGSMRVQQACYPPHFLESMATYEMRRGGYPAGCFVAVEADPSTGAPSDAVIGYCQSFPWAGPALPVCDVDPAAFAAAVGAATAALAAGRARGPGGGVGGVVYHVHDIATSAPGRGVGRALMAAALAHAAAAGHASAQLVAVMGMEAVWGKPEFGFARAEHPDGETLAGYTYGGVPAAYMVRSLGGDGSVRG